MFLLFLTMFSLPGLPSARDTPSPIDPESIQVPLSYEPDPADLALSSVPGQEIFDPRKRKFSAEELKPQPMIKKARKVFIPEDMKVRRRPGSGRKRLRPGSDPSALLPRTNGTGPDAGRTTWRPRGHGTPGG